jgi:hypothetical protein
MLEPLTQTHPCPKSTLNNQAISNMPHECTVAAAMHHLILPHVATHDDGVRVDDPAVDVREMFV